MVIDDPEAHKIHFNGKFFTCCKQCQDLRDKYIESQGRENTQGLINKELLLD